MGVRREKWLGAKPMSNAITFWFIGTISVTAVLYKSPLQYSMYSAWLPWITMGIFILMITLSLSAPVPRPERVDNYPSNWPWKRYKVLVRDSFKCQNSPNHLAQEVHHIVPLSRGGTNKMSNLVSLCKRCHIACHPHLYNVS